MNISKGTQLAIELINSAVNGFAWKGELNEEFLPEAISWAREQSLAATLAAAVIEIDKAGVGNAITPDNLSKCKMIKAASTGKAVQVAIERRQILSDLSSRGIWHMPLKGVVMEDLYPRAGMREMADNDILFDMSYQQKVRDYFVGRGYTVDRYAVNHDDGYIKAPFYNFEMHTFLGEDHMKSDVINEYYGNPWNIMIADADDEYGYHMSDEDFYIYMIVHAYKHFNNAGVGIKVLVDSRVYFEKYGDSLDWEYIEKMCRKLGVFSFERVMYRLTEVLMGSGLPIDYGRLDATESATLDIMLRSDTWGSAELADKIGLIRDQSESGLLEAGFDISEEIKTATKLRYFAGRLFPPPREMKGQFPICKVLPILLPSAYIYRLTVLSFKSRKRLAQEARRIVRVR